MYRDLNLARNFLDLLFPQLCVACRSSGSLLCPECFMRIDFIAEQCCIGCRAVSEKGLTHIACQRTYLPTRLLCPCDYKQALSAKIIASLKYDLIKDLDLICAQIIFKFMIEQNLLPDEDFILSFVSMHKSKQALRSFNQSELIANCLGKILVMPVLPTLEKIRKTQAQMLLSLKDRQTNLIGAFSALPTAKGKNILLVDDVITTGSTMLECTKTLIAAGAKQVQCLAFARD